VAVSVEIRLRSLEEYIKRRHGKTRNTTPDEEMVIFRYADQIIEYVKDNWPVDTGTSRDRWLYEFKATAGRLSLFVENPMFYSEFVHRAGGSPNDPLWRRIVPEAWAIFKEPMLADVRRRVDATERAIERKKKGRSEGLLDLLRRPDFVDTFAEFFGV
tara:strand:+ start:209 stop:682 length:474 start_codon:yes stop_codon:yes gene_type:complete